jgi:hypothetical protein
MDLLRRPRIDLIVKNAETKLDGLDRCGTDRQEPSRHRQTEEIRAGVLDGAEAVSFEEQSAAAQLSPNHCRPQLYLLWLATPSRRV